MRRSKPQSFQLARLAVLAAALTLAGACASGRTLSIGRLLEDPGRYDGETVRVEGRVMQSVGALGYGAYRINDGSGTMNVVTTEGGAPAEGAKIGVQGTFRAVYTFGSNSGTAIIEKRRYRP
jgi:hypothetical protein